MFLWYPKGVMQVRNTARSRACATEGWIPNPLLYLAASACCSRDTAEICDSPLLSRLEPNCVLRVRSLPLHSRSGSGSGCLVSVCPSAPTPGRLLPAPWLSAAEPQSCRCCYTGLYWCSFCTLSSGSQLVLDFWPSLQVFACSAGVVVGVEVFGRVFVFLTSCIGIVLRGKGAATVINLSLTSSFCWNLKCSLETWSPVNQLIRCSVSSVLFVACLCRADCWSTGALGFIFPQLNLSLFK